MISPAARLKTIDEYYFSTKLREINSLNEQGYDIINLGVGSPDMPPDPAIIQKLNEYAVKDEYHGYQPYTGIPELRRSITAFYKRRYQCSLSNQEVLPLIGSKEGIMHISLAYLNPGDRVLIPSLGYPTYTSVTKLVGAEPVYYPLLEDHGWEPDWNWLGRLDTSNIKLMWLNYPHMPTGTRGSSALFTKFLDFAFKNDILLCHDNPYSFILNSTPQSILSEEGANEVAIELSSMSKTFNMAGWRVGWVCGDQNYLNPILRVKSNMDSGMFKPIQLAASLALNLDDDWFDSLNQEYNLRQKIAYQILDKLGCQYEKDQSGLFIWARTPEGSGDNLSNELLDQYRVFVVPGHIFGEDGNNYIRISLSVPQDRLKEALDRIINI